MEENERSVKWLLLGVSLILANLVIGGACLFVSPVVWIGLCNIGGAAYIFHRLNRSRDCSRKEKLEALRRYREELAKLPASREVYKALDGIDYMEDRLRRQG